MARPTIRIITALATVVAAGTACSSLPPGGSSIPVATQTSAPSTIAANSLSPSDTKGAETPAATQPSSAESNSPAPTIAPCCVVVPTPVPNESLAESDAFWDYWADPPHGFVVFEAGSLEENVDTAHLVVRGHIINLYVGEYWQVIDDGAPRTPLGYVTIAVSEVLKGTPVERTPGYVEVGLGSADLEILDRLSGRLPQHDNVWFLLRDVDLEPRDPANNSEIAEFAYLPTNDLQGVLRDIDGKVQFIKPQWTEQNVAREHFPLPLQGSTFDDLVESIRQLH